MSFLFSLYHPECLAELKAKASVSKEATKNYLYHLDLSFDTLRHAYIFAKLRRTRQERLSLSLNSRLRKSFSSRMIRLKRGLLAKGKKPYYISKRCGIGIGNDRQFNAQNNS
jgi:hypothetical protein